MSAPTSGRNGPWLAAVLAAGEGSRFGGGKQMVLLGGQPLVSWPIRAALDAGLDGVLVVVGFHASQVRQVLPKDPRLEVIENPNPADGMGGSLALAARRAGEKDAVGLVMLLGDMPFVTAHDIATVVRAAQGSESGVAAGSINGKRNHPVAFSREYFAELAGLGGDKGARDVLDKLGTGLALVEVEPETRIDIDDPEDLSRAAQKWQAFKKQ